MEQYFDVVIVGGGVIGSAIAYFLSANADFRGRIAVIERDPSYAASSSSLSASAIRQQFGTAPNIRMSAFSIEFLRDVQARLSVADHVADIGLREPGYLFLGTAAQMAGFEAKHRVQRGEGVAVELLGQQALGERFAGLNTEDLAVGSLGIGSEGWFDGPGLHQAYRRKARSQGVTYIAGEVTGFDVSGQRLCAALLSDGGTVRCEVAVNAAGAWSGAVGKMAGIHVPVVPRKRCIFVVDSPAEIPGGHFIHDPGGVWIRPEGHLYICGTTPSVENEPGDFGLEVSHDLFEDIIWPALAHRIPAFERLKLLRAWAGLYDYNLFDQSALIGRHPNRPNFIMANGFSGHGMMHSAGTGLGVSELIAYGAYRTLDLTPFHVDRIAYGCPIAEHVY